MAKKHQVIIILQRIVTFSTLPRMSHLEIVELTVCRCWDVEAGDVQDDLLAMGGQDPPLALVPLLEEHRVHPRRWAVHPRELRRAKLGRCLLEKIASFPT